MCERHHWNTLSYYLSRSNAQRICANGPYDSGRVTRFARFNVLFRRLITRQQSVDISFSPGPQQQTRVEAERGGRMGKTDGRTLYPLHRPCSAYYAGSANNQLNLRMKQTATTATRNRRRPETGRRDDVIAPLSRWPITISRYRFW